MCLSFLKNLKGSKVPCIWSICHCPISWTSSEGCWSTLTDADGGGIQRAPVGSSSVRQFFHYSNPGNGFTFRVQLNSGRRDIFDYVIICIAPPPCLKPEALIRLHGGIWQQPAGSANIPAEQWTMKTTRLLITWRQIPLMEAVMKHVAEQRDWQRPQPKTDDGCPSFSPSL